MRVLDQVELRAVAGGGVLPPEDHNNPMSPHWAFEWGIGGGDSYSSYIFDFGAKGKAEVPPKSGEKPEEWYERAERVITDALKKANINIDANIKYEKTKPDGEKTSLTVEVKASNGK